VLQATLEQVQGRAGILAHGPSWVGARTSWIWDSGEVKDSVAAANQLARSGISCIGVEQGGVAKPRSVGATRPCDACHLVALLL
jgi:hypothetical protein